MATGTQGIVSKVPQVVAVFWVIKVLATTVGETAADTLNTGLGFGLGGTTLVMSGLLVVVLILQLRAPSYVPALYWGVVVLLSIVGTLLTDNLTDVLGVPLEVSTALFVVALVATFAVWWSLERTLSIATITAGRREGFYWLAVLVTFALGTAAGDLVAEQLNVGYAPSVALFVGLIALVALARLSWRLSAVAAFWAVYVLTRPLGASVGDTLSQDSTDGGLGFGPTPTTAVFTVVIVGLVGYLTATRADRQPVTTDH